MTGAPPSAAPRGAAQDNKFTYFTPQTDLFCHSAELRTYGNILLNTSAVRRDTLRIKLSSTTPHLEIKSRYTWRLSYRRFSFFFVLREYSPTWLCIFWFRTRIQMTNVFHKLFLWTNMWIAWFLLSSNRLAIDLIQFFKFWIVLTILIKDIYWT